MLETIKSINDVVNGLVWGVPAMVCIIGVGILMSVEPNLFSLENSHMP